jgi:hypothetical protein
MSNPYIGAGLSAAFERLLDSIFQPLAAAAVLAAVVVVSLSEAAGARWLTRRRDRSIRRMHE